MEGASAAKVKATSRDERGHAARGSKDERKRRDETLAKPSGPWLPPCAKRRSSMRSVPLNGGRRYNPRTSSQATCRNASSRAAGEASVRQEPSDDNSRI